MRGFAVDSKHGPIGELHSCRQMALGICALGTIWDALHELTSSLWYSDSVPIFDIEDHELKLNTQGAEVDVV